PGQSGPAASRTLVSRRDALAVQATAPTMMRERGLAMAAGSGSGAGGEAAAPVTGRTLGIALPPAVLHGTQARAPATRTGVRRRWRLSISARSRRAAPVATDWHVIGTA